MAAQKERPISDDPLFQTRLADHMATASYRCGGNTIFSLFHEMAGLANRSNDPVDRKRLPYKYLADWTDRIASGEVPAVKPQRPAGIERNVVATVRDWSKPTGYMHDLSGTDRRNPTVNGYGPLYGAPELSTDEFPILDPVANTADHFVAPVRDEDNTLWLSGGGDVVGWVNTRQLFETGDAENAIGWTAWVLDTNCNGQRDEYTEPDEPFDPSLDRRVSGAGQINGYGFYAVMPSPVDGSVWGSNTGVPACATAQRGLGYM